MLERLRWQGYVKFQAGCNIISPWRTLILSHLGTATVNCYVVSGDQVTDYNANITAAIGATYV